MECYVVILNAFEEYPLVWEIAHNTTLNKKKENNLTKMTNCNPQGQVQNDDFKEKWLLAVSK